MNKFIKIQTNHTKAELDAILAELDPIEVEFLRDLYLNFSYHEFVDNNGFVCMYAYMEEQFVKEICRKYVDLGVSFRFTDITKEVKFHDTYFFPKEERDAKLVALIHNFINVNISVDDVLEKISELGSDSLTDLDRQILNHI